MTRVIFYDLETSGLEKGRHQIIQIGAVAVDREFRELDRFERKLKFDHEKASAEALEMNSYSAKEWGREAVAQIDGLKDFCEWSRGFADLEFVSKRTGKPYRVALGAGHNARRFDSQWLRPECKRLGLFLPLAYRPLDTYELAEWWRWQANPGGVADLRLETLAEHFGIESDGAHDALADAVMSAKVAYELLGSMDPTHGLGYPGSIRWAENDID